MIACVDVGYSSNGALAACVCLKQWKDSSAAIELTTQVSTPVQYVPGAFFQRELPGVLAVLNQLDCQPKIIVVDGYVTLSPAGKPGLGAYVYQEFGETIPVIGVAKTKFKEAVHGIEIIRGQSRKPLIVTAQGITPQLAAEHIGNMQGPHRIPQALKRVDQLSRGYR